MAAWGHRRGGGEGRARGHTLPHHPVTSTTLTPAPITALGLGWGQHTPGQPDPRSSRCPRPRSPPTPRSPRPHGLQPYKVGAEPHAPWPPCVHHKSGSTLPLLTVNTSAAPAGPRPPRGQGRAHPVPPRLPLGTTAVPSLPPGRVTPQSDATRAASRPARRRMLCPRERGWGASPRWCPLRRRLWHVGTSLVLVPACWAEPPSASHGSAPSGSCPHPKQRLYLSSISGRLRASGCGHPVARPDARVTVTPRWVGTGRGWVAKPGWAA